MNDNTDAGKGLFDEFDGGITDGDVNLFDKPPETKPDSQDAAEGDEGVVTDGDNAEGDEGTNDEGDNTDEGDGDNSDGEGDEGDGEETKPETVKLNGKEMEIAAVEKHLKATGALQRQANVDISNAKKAASDNEALLGVLFNDIDAMFTDLYAPTVKMEDYAAAIKAETMTVEGVAAEQAKVNAYNESITAKKNALYAKAKDFVESNNKVKALNDDKKLELLNVVQSLSFNYPDIGERITTEAELGTELRKAAAYLDSYGIPRGQIEKMLLVDKDPAMLAMVLQSMINAESGTKSGKGAKPGAKKGGKGKSTNSPKGNPKAKNEAAIQFKRGEKFNELLLAGKVTPEQHDHYVATGKIA